MVKIIKDFVLKCKDEIIFEKIRDSEIYDKSEYTIQEEINEPDRLYRKILLKKPTLLDTIPTLLKEQLPIEFVQTVTNLITEEIFYNKEKKIQYSIQCNPDNVYTLSGNIRFIQLDNINCKVIVLLYLEFNNEISKYINNNIRSLIIPILETKIPELFVNNLNDTYKSLLT